ncbi:MULTISPECIES: amino acid ABC transporter permease [Burkholderia]|uniref:ABC polar amino acid family transporter inner membrane subunit n=1 Tax=Burkholderia anthina TaxID=179879 RepID=A0A6P2G598_9BURK|nr:MULTISPECIES: amino acid ABC transporter permease [Burkholderia]AXK67876.1 amino acid ABC transporter permease [Burkholderia sp. IDO3]MBM2766375.1 amino acid ABC transporter permease [Burkholderia anthina]PCD60809.1 amino acid ABC transporter permease [Burkholderia sp. IDO3]QTD94988.1 amino acid ABC transporter permease [Burkholderia anthina]VVU48747.1 ABC polar amino acid family transporter inner membrane subunit [Burkholderia anthina]
MNELLELWKSWLPDLLGGYGISLQVTGLSLLIGIPLGAVLAVMVPSPNKIVRAVAIGFVEIGRGAPALILLQFMYFGLPKTGMALTSFFASVVALAWCTGAYTSEIIRAGFEAVPYGQKEAAAVIGLSSFDALRFVVAPQGLRVALPALLGFSVMMLQATSLCYTIALPELFGRASNIGSDTFQYMPVLVLAALLFAAICIPATICVSILERRLGRHASN